MECKNKIIKVNGIRKSGLRVDTPQLECIITNDERGKTLAINDGYTQFKIPFEPIEKYLK